MVDMTDERAHAPIDDALEALTRPEPPGDHVARVLARTGPSVGLDGSPGRPPARPIWWALPVAASLLVATGVTWALRDVTLPPISAGLGNDSMDRDGRLTDGSESVTARSASGPYQPWGAPRGIDRPVLPPEAYWGMDAFEEWKRLRPSAGGVGSGTGRRAPGPGWSRSRAVAGTRGGGARNDRARAPQLAWAPVPSGLPPIELETIAPSPLAFEPLADPAPIDLPAITLDPIVIAPLEHEERP